MKSDENRMYICVSVNDNDDDENNDNNNNNSDDGDDINDDNGNDKSICITTIENMTYTVLCIRKIWITKCQNVTAPASGISVLPIPPSATNHNINNCDRTKT